MVDRTVAERDDVDRVGGGEADEGFLVDFVGVLGLEDGLVTDPRPHERDQNRPTSVYVPGIRDPEALRVNVQVVLADPLLLKPCRGAKQEPAQPLDRHAGNGLRQLDHQHRSAHGPEPNQPGLSPPTFYSAWPLTEAEPEPVLVNKARSGLAPLLWSHVRPNGEVNTRHDQQTPAQHDLTGVRLGISYLRL
ncbi:hypothetical protein DN051_40645 [Streptomyces cadmiisoli]|uniref:Uncharacterized protein n=1 Tax=Streptomyces cadmiisoli TaxID=2184053 RepID=A0A2Z4JAX8_9ACTN|nr:hypothetical protein DN051_00165 [Streptomyces cadmiisoli]AWW42120.1 hypothetical protein DN051_40645 [Streptomyces cadmiisoli]